jgi:hypothetical protein
MVKPNTGRTAPCEIARLKESKRRAFIRAQMKEQPDSLVRRIVPRSLKEGGDQGHEPREIEYHEEKLEVTSDFSDHGAIAFVMLFDDL